LDTARGERSYNDDDKSQASNIVFFKINFQMLKTFNFSGL